MKILLARVIRGGWERREIGFALAKWVAWCAANGHEIIIADPDQEPTPAARNAMVECARAGAFDLLIMIDGDIIPNLEWFEFAVTWFDPTDFGHPRENAAAIIRRRNEGIHVIGSPYCGGPPNYEVQAMDLKYKSDGFLALMQRVEREDAKNRIRLMQVGAVGTGLIAIDVRAFDLIEPPYFAYTYADERETIAGTEDFYFCDKLHRAGGKIFMAWDYWSGHSKPVMIQKPE
jgi:hypothetical protein